MKTLLDIMRVDFITANGKKNSFTRFLILSAVISAVSGILLSPMVHIIVLLVFAGMTVSALYQAAEKSNAEKMFTVLPVRRVQIVQARFLMTAGIFTAMCLLCAVTVPIAVATKLYVSIWDIDIAEVLRLVGNVTGKNVSETSFFLITLCTVFWIGMLILPRSMRKYLRTSGKIEDGKKMFRTAKKVLIGIAIFYGIGIVITGITQLSRLSAMFGTIMMLVMELISALSQAGGGVLVCLLLITMGIGAAVYQYVCASIEFDEKEL